jgi:hypothetical protein
LSPAGETRRGASMHIAAAQRGAPLTEQLALIGSPSGAGACGVGQERAPAALRAAGLVEALSGAGFRVSDLGDSRVVPWRPDRARPRAQNLDAGRRHPARGLRRQRDDGPPGAPRAWSGRHRLRVRRVARRMNTLDVGDRVQRVNRCADCSIFHAIGCKTVQSLSAVCSRASSVHSASLASGAWRRRATTR